MASLGENLRSFIVTSTGVIAASSNWTASTITRAGAVQQNEFMQDPPSPRIWFTRTSQVEDVDMSAVGGLVESFWDIECQSDDVNEAIAIADAVKARLNGYQGVFGTTASSTSDVQGIFLTDHDDDYIPKDNAADEGTSVAALSARIFNTP